MFDILEGIMGLKNPDSYVEDPIIMMNCVKGDTADPAVEKRACEVGVWTSGD